MYLKPAVAAVTLDCTHRTRRLSHGTIAYDKKVFLFHMLTHARICICLHLGGLSRGRPQARGAISINKPLGEKGHSDLQRDVLYSHRGAIIRILVSLTSCSGRWPMQLPIEIKPFSEPVSCGRWLNDRS
jgi:hypothetical protein